MYVITGFLWGALPFPLLILVCEVKCANECVSPRLMCASSESGESIGISGSWSLQVALKEVMSMECSVEEVVGTVVEACAILICLGEVCPD